jgi:fatty-acyl-CoA synthase
MSDTQPSCATPLGPAAAVLESAVVGVPDTEWGEIVVAYVALRPGASATESELVEHVKQRIARFQAPRRVIFGDLPKTATGKIQKFKLREPQPVHGLEQARLQLDKSST